MPLSLSPDLLAPHSLPSAPVFCYSEPEADDEKRNALDWERRRRRGRRSSMEDEDCEDEEGKEVALDYIAWHC